MAEVISIYIELSPEAASRSAIQSNVLLCEVMWLQWYIGDLLCEFTVWWAFLLGYSRSTVMTITNLYPWAMIEHELPE